MKFRLKIDKERCKGCGLCLDVCDRKVLHMSRELNSKGQQYATSKDDGLCVGCRKCTDICPDAAIEIQKEPDDLSAEQGNGETDSDSKGSAE